MRMFTLIYVTLCLIAPISLEQLDAANTTTEITTESTYSSNNFTFGKHENLLSCGLISLNAGEYHMFPNKTIFVEVYDMMYNESFYIQRNSTVLLCPKDTEPIFVDMQHLAVTRHITSIGLAISMVCLVMHLVVFALVSEMRNLPGCNLAALCFSLFFTYLFISINNFEGLPEGTGICVATAALTQLFGLASFMWMFIMSLDILRSLLRATGSLRITTTEFRKKRFGLYCLGAYGVSFVFVLIAVLSDTMPLVPEQLQPNFSQSCWFTERRSLLTFFAGPILFIICLNFLFFALGAYIIHANKMKTDQDSHKSSLRKTYLMYFRLSVIMGVTWVVGALAPLVNMDWIWYLMVFLNTLQGLFIFLAFTCSSKVKKYFRQKIMGARRPSEQTLSPTFQSYCYYAESIEKDLDKIVDKGKEMEDIVVHL